MEYLDFKNMYKGLKKSCKNVRWKTSVTQYEVNGLKNTAKLIRDIRDDNYKISPYQEFEIFEPKPRHITATRIKDRQVQRSLCDTTLYKAITKSFVYDNCACQLGKGTAFAIKRLKGLLQKYYRQHGSNEGYFLKCDVHHFFDSLDHNILKCQLRKRINDEHILHMVDDIIDSFGDRGIGLGSQVSQLLALMCLDELDHFIKEQLHIKFSVRYMDDIILTHESKDYLIYCKREIEEYLRTLGLELNSKTVISPLRKGVSFLNWRYIVSNTGKVIMLPNVHKIARKRRKLKAMNALGLPINIVSQAVQGMTAHLSQGNSHKAISQLNTLLHHRKEHYND